MKRIQDSLILVVNTSIGEDSQNIDFTFEKIVNPSFHLRFSPVVAQKMGQATGFSYPRIGFDKAFQNLNFSGITDF